MKNSIWTTLGMAALLAVVAGNAGAVETVLSEESPNERAHSLYLGMGYGPTTVSPGNEKRSVEGIDFSLKTDANDLGGMFYAGYWMSEHVALEIGGRDYGTVDVPFSFSDPHDNSSGTGESGVSINGFNASLLLGFDLVSNVQVIARGGMLSWKEKMESRFDIPGEPAIRRELETSGTGLLYGAGLNWRFESTWALSAQYEHVTLDNDEISRVTLGLSYDFMGWFNR